ADGAAVRRRRDPAGAAPPERRRRQPRRPGQDPQNDRARRHERPGDQMTMFAWLLTYLIHSSVLLGLVWLLTRRGRLEPAASDLLWKVALLAGLVTGTIQSRLQLSTPAAVMLPPAAPTDPGREPEVGAATPTDPGRKPGVGAATPTDPGRKPG